MTHRTVPLDLLVRVRDALFQHQCSQGCQVCKDIAELTAQIEQQGQGEPVAWKMVPCDPTAAMIDAGAQASKYLGLSGAAAVWKYMLLAAPPATPQDSVPAWAMELVAEWRSEILRPTGIMDRTLKSCADELESRALALAQTKFGNPP